MSLIEQIRKNNNGIVVAGNHPAILQSILDFDFLSGETEPSVKVCLIANRSTLKLFFGTKEVLIPCVKDMAAALIVAPEAQWLLNLQSGRRVFETTNLFFQLFPKALGAHVFAENVPEKHATDLIALWGDKKIIAGPSGVGILVSGVLKLGASGGVGLAQIAQGKLTQKGSLAVVSTSGGVTNELIVATAHSGKGTSFSLSIGGDRFPITSLSRVLELAQEDSQTKAVVYFGELGGVDEYEIADLVRTKKLTKPVLAYVAGTIDEAFEERMQFGHAKALVARNDESARAKRDALHAVGVIAPETFPEFLEAMKSLPGEVLEDVSASITPLMNRAKSILSTREIVDLESTPEYVSGKKLAKSQSYAFARATLSALLGRDVSDVTAAFTESILTQLIDHGGHVSGAVNTMVTARAGKDLVSSLVAGLLTVGPRFGGAINESARTWLRGVAAGKDAKTFVEEETRAGRLILGIGHRKYRVGVPDPRVEELSRFASLLKKHPHYDFARAVEKIMTGKQGTLILNVDGAIASLTLDILTECEGLTHRELTSLIDAEFFNALFVIPRSIGFIAHFMEQKQNDEGLFRLPDELLFVHSDKKQKKRK